jgi:hypothetical protein
MGKWCAGWTQKVHRLWKTRLMLAALLNQYFGQAVE